MRASTMVRFAVGVVVALLVGSSSIAQGGTVAWWRFEEGPADGFILKGGVPDGAFHPGVADSSGNGNALSAWSEGGGAGHAYRTDLAAGTILQTGDANTFSAQNTGGGPGMFTAPGAAIQTISPAAFTVEVSFKPETGGYRTIIGRDSQGTATSDQALAALYLQLLPDHAIAIKFCDVSGRWHQAVSLPGTVQGFTFPNVNEGRWYHAAAVSTGSMLSLYLNDVAAGTGYQLVAHSDLTTSGSPNTALTAGAGSFADCQAGTWTVGRGLFNGGHGDRAYGFIDEVRISDVALVPDQFLFSPPPEVMILSPDVLDVATIDPPTSVSLVIPDSCNASQAVDVTVTSDNPAAAKPAGSSGSTVVHFPAGAEPFTPVSIEFGSAGQASFTLSATGGCLAGAGTALTVTVHAAQSIDFQVPYDVMGLGSEQQTVLTADFGLAGSRNVSATSTGTSYNVTPGGVITIDAQGLITAVGSGTATITATHAGMTSPQRVIAVMPMGHTVAYWRFEEGPADAPVSKGGVANGVFYPGVADSSGNGNHLSAWSQGGFAGYAYRTDVAAASVPETHAANNFSVQNTGDVPGMFTETGAAIQTISPAAFTIEVSFKPENGGHRTLIGRDSEGATPENLDYSALYLQMLPDNAIAIKFADVSGYWHQAVSDPNLIQGFAFPNTAAGHWYHVAAVSDGTLLSLYLNDVDAETGYQLVAQTDMTISGSPNTALTAGMNDGGDWDAGNWSVGRGLYNGGHGDRAWGFIDEVRISDVALHPSQFLFTPEYMVLWPEAMNAAPVDAPTTVSLLIPGTCNETQAVDVTITSDNPAVAKPAGSQGSAVVHFAAGAGLLQPVQIETLGVGVADFTLSGTGGCPAGPGTALTVTVHALESIDLQVPHDVMHIGLTQQAAVVAGFGTAGTRDVSAASFGTSYSVAPAGVIDMSPDGQIGAVGLGTATITATHGGLTSAPRTVAVNAPDARLKVAGSGVLLVDLNATDASAGQAVWVNKGSLGDFALVGQPMLGTVANEQAVSFNGTDAYQGPGAPAELRGSQAHTVEVWAYNPVVECTQCLETMVAWGSRGGGGGVCGGNLAFGFGDHPNWGAVGAFCGASDISWNDAGGSPPLGEWRHLVYTYDPNVEGGTTTVFDNGVQVNTKMTGALAVRAGNINLCMQNATTNPLDFFTDEVGVLSLAAVRVHDGALTPDEVAFNHRAGITGRGQVPPDLNLDTHVDQADVELFSQCAAGSQVALTAECALADFDLDDDGDQVDFAILQRCYTGPDTVASPDCLQQ